MERKLAGEIGSGIGGGRGGAESGVGCKYI